MSQVVVLPVVDEYSWFPDLDEAAAAIGGPFMYRLCEERPLDVPDTLDLESLLCEVITEQSGVLLGEMVSELVGLVSSECEALAYALRDRNLTAWYPVGAVLKWEPEL